MLSRINDDNDIEHSAFSSLVLVHIKSIILSHV